MMQKRLKTQAEIEREKLDAIRYAQGAVKLDAERLLLIYARQSTSRQYVTNIYSAIEQRDGLLERACELGWVRDEQRILYIENQIAKKTHVSGTLRIDQRPGLQALTDVIDAGKAGAVLVVSVDRITRDPDMITPVVFAQKCKAANVLIITDEYIYDFNNPARDDIGKFVLEANMAKEYIRKQIKGKMLKNRTRKANMGKVANGVAPVGLRLDESRDNLVPSSHAERVAWLYRRFRAHDGSLIGLLHEVLDMAKRGEPLFPDADDIDPKTIYLKRMQGGWTIGSRPGLQYILTNPMYRGHLVFNKQVVKYNAHPAIVDEDDWNYAFCHLSDVDLDGTPIERENRAVRYTQQGSTNAALLAGTRHTGEAVIDGVNGAHVYVQMPYNRYRLVNRHKLSITGYEASIRVSKLDRIIEERLLHWLEASEKACQHIPCDQAPHLAMGTVEKSVQPLVEKPDDLTITIQELTKVERALRIGADVMDDDELRETYAKKARLVKRRAELEKAKEQKERIEREQAQAEDDMQQAANKWGKWSLERRRRFIRLITESITLEEIADGWLRLTIVWTPIMGFVSPIDSDTRAVDVAYIWKRAGIEWSTEDLDILRAKYDKIRRNDLLALLPSRSWASIKQQARILGLTREKHRDAWDLPENLSLNDARIQAELGITELDKLVYWQHNIANPQRDNGENQLTSPA